MIMQLLNLTKKHTTDIIRWSEVNVMDVKINSDDLNFKFRVNSIILKDDKVLLVDMKNNGFWCCPGGHVHIGEDTLSAVKRETKEEAGIEAKKIKLVGIIENFFSSKDGRKHHELSFYYLLKDLKIPTGRDKDFHYIEHDEDKLVELNFKWIPLDDVEKYDIRPAPLKQMLSKKEFEFTHTFVKDLK